MIGAGAARLTRAAARLFLVFGAAASTSPAHAQSAPTAPAAPTVRAVIVERAGANAGETLVTVRLEPTGLTLGAYQGTFHYAPGTIAIVSATTPKDDGTRLVNAADSLHGIVRFAGFTVSGFHTLDAFTLVLRATHALSDAKLSVDLDVAADLNGVPVKKSLLIGARGVSR